MLFSVKVDEEVHDITFEIRLPENYPSMDEPTIQFSCKSISDEIVSELSTRLDKHIRQNVSVNGLLLDCIGWVQHQIAHAIRNKDKPFYQIEFIPFLR